jgi:hypothetical protein
MMLTLQDKARDISDKSVHFPVESLNIRDGSNRAR